MTESNDDLLTMRDIHIEGLSGETWMPIIKGVDLALKRGEVLGLIGESGAGKSTLGLAAMGYTRDGCRISQGSIEFAGMDLMSATDRQKRGLRGKRIAYVAQSAAASFNPAHRLIDQYTEGPVQHDVMTRGQAESDAIELYRRMRLPDPEDIGFRYPHQVSGGQLQRAMTAMAMSCRPDLIVFDEPTTALDVTTQIEVLSAIRDIVTQFKTAAIYITHDLAVVAQMADRIKVLLKGEEVEEAETAKMLAAPTQDYTKSLWSVGMHKPTAKPEIDKTTTPILSMRNVTASYGAFVALKDVSIDVGTRQTVAIVGESGSGKSTAARAITGLLVPQKGEIVFDGQPLPGSFKNRSLEQLRQIQMIYQMADTALNPKQRLRELIGRPAEVYLGLKGRALTERVRELLHIIGLEPDTYIDRLPSELSGGQKQRIGIARALAAEPKLIICDEVTSALDQLVAQGILKLLDDLQTQLDLSYIFITHDLSIVRSIADDVAVMKLGSIVELGPKEEIFQPPQHPYTELLLSSAPDMDPNWLTQILVERTAQSQATSDIYNLGSMRPPRR